MYPVSQESAYQSVCMSVSGFHLNALSMSGAVVSVLQLNRLVLIKISETSHRNLHPLPVLSLVWKVVPYMSLDVATFRMRVCGCITSS